MLETILIATQLCVASWMWLAQIPAASNHLMIASLVAALLIMTGIVAFLAIRLSLLQQKSLVFAPHLAGEGDAEHHRLMELLQTIFNTTTDAVFVKDRQGKYLMANEATGLFVGKPLAEIIGQDDRAVFAAGHAEFLMRRDRQIMDSGNIDTAEEELYAAGSTRTYLAMKAPYRNRLGQVMGLVGISRDITERKHAEQALRESEQSLRLSQERLAYAQEIAGLGSWHWEPESNEVYWSPTCFERLGLSPR